MSNQKQMSLSSLNNNKERTTCRNLAESLVRRSTSPDLRVGESEGPLLEPLNGRVSESHTKVDFPANVPRCTS